MGQKVNPNSLRIGINRTWDSIWYANRKNYKTLLHQDLKIRKTLKTKLKEAGVSKLVIERDAQKVTIHIHTSRPGVIIGQQGSAIEKLRAELEKETGEKIDINVAEIKKPFLSAELVGQNVVRQLERRMPYRRAIKSAMEKAIESGAEGIKIQVAGRLNGVEIARSEFFSKGKIPLHTFRAKISYSSMPARTTYGAIGVKTWIYNT